MIINKTASSVDPDEMAHYEPYYLDLHCLHSYLYQSTGLTGLRGMNILLGEATVIKIVLTPV